ncbi:MAG TPA: tRNA glutamyl-Q(34) synthetase GluQRS [Permianibacter sp.]|nr:tRNA glutamyl-Q(34) synthetase GluQRS [Permianibacter sp.]
MLTQGYRWALPARFGHNLRSHSFLQTRMPFAQTQASVIGRFAPSPSGPLHFGSLVAALGSFLSAKSQGGLWRVRIEDIDPPREPAGAAATILQQLQAFGLHWDGVVLYQSSRHDRYDEVLQQLARLGLIYGCACTRRELQGNGGRCANRCRERSLPLADGVAWRLIAGSEPLPFDDAVFGPCRFPETEQDDVVLKRRDGLYAYQLAVVVDDIDQGISEIVRGADLLDATPRQLYLWRLLGRTPPRFAHLPLVVGADGRKLSKQNYAPAISEADAVPLLKEALAVLGQPIPATDRIEPLLAEAVAHWRLDRVPKGPVVRG